MYEDNIKFHGFFSTQGYPNKVQRITFLFTLLLKNLFLYSIHLDTSILV